MTQQQAQPEMMGAKEAAEVLGVRVPNLYKLAGLPKPYQRLAMGPIWRADEIRSFARSRGRKE